jgi:hypothetical protein
MEPERRAELRRRSYAEYLLTREWKETCAKALQRAGYRCQVCNANGPLNVCRNTYERLGCELPSDLIILCEECLAIAVVRAPLLAQAAIPTSSIDPRKPGLSFQQVLALYDAGRLTDQQFYALLSQVPDKEQSSKEVRDHSYPGEPAMVKLAEQNEHKLTHLHRQVLEHYRPSVSYRQLGELIGVGKDKAGDLVKELRKWGFLEEDVNE